jgi:hypothetical protein
MRSELLFGRNEDQLAARIDYAAQQPDERRSCVSAAIATGAAALANIGDSNSDCGSMWIETRPLKAAKTMGTGNLPRYVSLSGKVAPKPCAQVIRELRPVANVS